MDEVKKINLDKMQDQMKEVEKNLGKNGAGDPKRNGKGQRKDRKSKSRNE